MPYSTLGTARGLPFAILETREGPVLGGGKESVVADRLICCHGYGYRPAGLFSFGF